ncbi:MAG: hypothetical protein FWG02_01175 [Holophagaceae bacterium]|nr:hypothetical protein [Holophagaceae bacterium]
MKIAPCFVVSVLLFTLACRNPEYKAHQRSTPTLTVNVSIKTVAGASGLERELAAALRARLATLVTVVPEDVEPPNDALVLNVEIDGISQAQVSPLAVGAVAGTAVGVMAASSSRSNVGSGGLFSLLEGLVWGLNIASEVHAGQQRKAMMLGYVPPKIKGLITMGGAGQPRSVYIERISSKAIINEMQPLRESERYDQSYLNDELARAFASAVSIKLQRKFGWPAKNTASWYAPV